MSDEKIYFEPNEIRPYTNLGELEIPRTIELSNKEGKTLTLDFTGDKIVTSGDLPMDEATKIFVDGLSHYFYNSFIERKKVREALERVYDASYNARFMPKRAVAKQIVKEIKELGL